MFNYKKAKVNSSLICYTQLAQKICAAVTVISYYLYLPVCFDKGLGINRSAFAFPIYRGASLCGHSLNTDTHIKQIVLFVLTKKFIHFL